MKLTSLFLLSLTLLTITACNPQNDPEAISVVTDTPAIAPSATPSPKPLPTSTTRPSVTPTSPTPTATSSPTPVPSPRPFELNIRLTPVQYRLPFAYEDDIAFFIQDGRFIISNIADSQSTQTIWESEPLGNNVQGLAVTNDHAFLISDGNLIVWNVEDLSSPAVMTTTPAPAREAYLDVEENLLYLITFTDMDADEGQIATVDISLPNSPSELGIADLSGIEVLFPYLIVRNRLFLVNEGYIAIVDISDPAVAKPILQIPVPTNINSQLHLNGDLLFVGTHSDVFIFDLTDVAAPRQIGQYTNLPPNHMEIDGNVAYLFSQICGWEPTDDGGVSGGCGYLMEVVDFSNPASPRFEGLLRLQLETNQAFVESMTIQGDLMYFETQDALYVLNTSEARNPYRNQ